MNNFRVPCSKLFASFYKSFFYVQEPMKS